MSLLSSLPILGSVIEKISDRLLPDRSGISAQQAQLNTQEINNAPASYLRLWRSFLGWVLSLVFAWEVVLRPLLVTYAGDVPLPPSALEEVSRLLLGMLGLGW